MARIEKINRIIYVNGPVIKINEIIDALNDALGDYTDADTFAAEIARINELINQINNYIANDTVAPESDIDRLINNPTAQVSDKKITANRLAYFYGKIKDLFASKTELAAQQAALIAQKEDLEAQLADLEERLRNEMKDILFINMAPKIGYYQEDQIQAISSYEISNIPSEEKIAPVFTSDNVGREIMYYIGNGGGYNANETTGLRKTYRVNDNANWIWYNKDIVPACFKDADIRINRIFGCDNTYLLCLMTDGSYRLIHTNYSFDENDWKAEDNVSSMITNVSSDRFIHAKYLEDYDTFITFNAISWNILDDNWYRVRVWKYSTQELLRQDDIEGLSRYVEMSSNYSFLQDKEVHSVYYELTEEEKAQYRSSFNLGISSTESTFACNVTLLEKQETLVITRIGMQFNAVNLTSGNRRYQSVSYVPITYHFPLSVAKGENEGVITCNLQRGDIKLGEDTDFTSQINSKIGGNRSRLGGGYTNSSYDTLRGYVYRTGKTYTTPQISFSRTKEDSVDLEDPRYSCLKYDYISNGFYTPDASYWGKYFKSGLALWDTIFLSCTNSKGDYLLWVKDWRLVKDYEDKLVVEPVPGRYIPIDKTKFTDVLVRQYDKSVYTFTTQHPKSYASSYTYASGFTSVKMPDGSPRYFKSEYTNEQIKTREYFKNEIYNEDGSMQGFEIEAEEKEPLAVTIPKSSFNTGNDEDTYIFGGHVIYNPISDMYIVFGILDFGDREENDNIARDHIVAVRSNGDILSFGEPKDHAWPITGSKITAYNTTYYSPWFPEGSNVIDGHTIQVFFEEVHNGGHSCICVTFRFNEDFTDYEVINATAVPQGIFWLGTSPAPGCLQCYCLTYAGPTLGFCGQGETKSPAAYTDNYKINIRTQIPLFGTQAEEASYTDEEVIQGVFNSGVNTYTMYNNSASGLICYVPSVPIFLGGYYSEIVDVIPVILEPNLNQDTPGSFDGHRDANYIYLERDITDHNNIIAYARPIKIIEEGSAMFNKILIAKIETDDEKALSTHLYSINIGYNDWKFHGSNNTDDSFNKTDTTPIGTIIMWYSENNPESGTWLDCNGQDCSAYPRLVNILGSNNVPDMQGLFPRSIGSQSIDNTIHDGGNLGTKQGDAIRNITGYFGGNEHSGYDSGGAFYSEGSSYQGVDGSDWDNTRTVFDASRVVPTADENRPASISMRFLIKAE